MKKQFQDKDIYHRNPINSIQTRLKSTASIVDKLVKLDKWERQRLLKQTAENNLLQIKQFFK